MFFDGLIEERADGHQCQQQEQQAERSCHENGQGSARQDHGVAEICFHQISQNDAQDDRHHGKAQLPKQERGDTDACCQQHMEGAALIGIDACDAVDDDQCAHQLIGNPGDIGVQRRQDQAEHQHKNVDKQQTQQDSVQGTRVIPEQSGARDHALQHKGADQDSRAAVAGDAQGHQRNQRRAGSGVVCCLGGCHALNLTLAEVIAVFGHFLGLVIADKRGDAATGAGRCADNRADDAGDHPRPEALLDFLPGDPLLTDLNLRLSGRVVLGVIIGTTQQFGQRKETHQDSQKRNAAGQLAVSECEADHTADAVLANQGNEDTDDAAHDAFDDVVAGDAGDDAQPEEGNAEVLRRAESLRHLRNSGRGKQTNQRTDDAAEERGVQCHLQSFQRLPLQRHGIAVQRGSCIGRSTGGIDQNRGDGAAISTSAVDAQQ